MVDENYSSFTKTGPNKPSPMSPKITEKRGKGEREREREEKRLAAVFSFYSVDFRDFFLNDKTPMLKVTHRLLLRLTWFSKIQVYIYIYMYIYNSSPASVANYKSS